MIQPTRDLAGAAVAPCAALTPRQDSILRFIDQHVTEHGYPPTVRDIGRHFKIKSPNGVMCHLYALETKGAIARQPGKSRAITISKAAKTWLPYGGIVQ